MEGRHGKRNFSVNHATLWIALAEETQDSVVRRGDGMRAVLKAGSYQRFLAEKDMSNCGGHQKRIVSPGTEK